MPDLERETTPAAIGGVGSSPVTATGRGSTLGLVGVWLAVFVIAYDFTGLNIAIPSIEQSFRAPLATSQWVLNAYALAFGVLIVTAGRLADLFGRRRLFLAGAAIFAVSSGLSGAAPSIGLLIACRVAMGIGAAMVWPAAVGTMYALLPTARAGFAGGLILGIAGAGNAIGPVLGGLIVDAGGWRWAFEINVPLVALAMLAVLRAVPAARASSGKTAIDLEGIALLSAGLVALLLALDEGIGDGFGAPPIIALFACSALLLAAFAAVESRRGDAALVTRAAIGNRVFVATIGAALLVSAIFSAALFFLPHFMTEALHYSALRSGVGLLPIMAVFALVAFAAGPAYDRLGAKPVIALGAGCLGLGILLLSFLSAGSSYRSLVPGMIVLGIGMGLFYPSTTTAAVTALGPAASSFASGAVYMCQVAGGAIGLGLNTAIAATAPSLSAGIASAFRVDAALALIAFALVVAFVGDGSRRVARGRPAP